MTTDFKPVMDALNRPLRDLRLSVTSACNLRCDYCRPHGDAEAAASAEPVRPVEAGRIAGIFAGLGVRKVRLTGGEPLLRPDLPAVIAAVRAEPRIRDVALTTNGVGLRERARALKDAGLDRITVSADGLDAGGEKLLDASLIGGIEAAQSAELRPVKVNCVVRRGVNEDSPLRLLEALRGSGVVLRFIEYMDVGAPADWSLEAVVPGEEILRRIRTRHELTPLPRRSPSDVASRYALRDGGEIGLVAAVTQPFCEACVRARIAADGRLHTCLFGPGGCNVLEALRSGQPDRAVAERVAAIWRARTAAFCMNHDRLREERAEMYQIGG